MDHLVKGYCPGAQRPMPSGDGLVVRVRPFAGGLSQEQAVKLATLSERFGNGLIDLSARGNLQLRGVTPAGYPEILDVLARLGLLDENAEIESRRNIIVTPFDVLNDEVHSLAKSLSQALADAEGLTLPGKFGFAIDTGPSPVLQHASADIRLERSASGTLMLSADGAAVAKAVELEDAADQAVKLAHWFDKQRGNHRRMATLLSSGVPLPSDFAIARQQQRYVPTPGLMQEGALLGVAFGQLSSSVLAKLAALGPLRLTPWRMVLVEGLQRMPQISGLIHDPSDPLLRVVACSGAPACAQAHADTRALARQIAPKLGPQGFAHVSGCTKGCAHPIKAPLTIVATAQGFDLIEQGSARDLPKRRSLTGREVKSAL